MLSHIGMCHNFGSDFCKNSLLMGPIFHEKIPNYGSDFQIFFKTTFVLNQFPQNSSCYLIQPGLTYFVLDHLSCFIFHVGSSLPGSSNNLDESR